MIIQSEATLSDLIRDFKKFTARMFRKIQNSPESRRDWMLERFKLATESHSRNKIISFGNMAIILKKFTATSLCGQLDYIHLNPVRAGIVEKASHYVYSSASNYVSDSGL
jgi:hypothetical protein